MHMYLEFYGLAEIPFATTPDPRFLFLTPSHREALAQLIYGVREGTGFTVLTGEIGTGKTTLLQTLLKRLDPQVPVAMLVNPMLEFDGLLDLILDDLGVEKAGDSLAQRLLALRRFLLERAAAGHRTLVIIDEAQHLTSAALEQIRLLSNYESPSGKLLQIILSGQPELRAKLDLPELRQVKQRIGLRCAISPLTRQETRDYIVMRLRVARAANPRLFSEEAVDRMSKYARGIPRLINIVCEHSLLIGYADRTRRIDHRVVAEAIRTIEGPERGVGGRRPWWRLQPGRWRWLVGAGAAALAAMAGSVGGAIWYTGGAVALGDVMSAQVTGLLSGVEALLRP
jgi:general secretion pathway protein A